MTEYQLLDAFSCHGGGAVGYQQAGFTVTGIDLVNYERTYPGNFIQDDALHYVATHGHEYDAIHLSPPCQSYTRGNAGFITSHPRLIGAAREAAQQTGAPYIIENVESAWTELIRPIMLCGRYFGLSATDTDGTPLVMDRHRLFECHGFDIENPVHPKHKRNVQVAGAYGGARRDKWEARYIRKGGYVPPDLSVLQELMGITHIPNEKGLFEALPPAYTNYIGLYLRKAFE